MNRKNIILGIFIALLIVFIAFVCTQKHKLSLKSSLVGDWTVEVEKCHVENREWNWCLNTIEIFNKNKCRLTPICNSETTVKEDWKNATGTWKIISTNPDSIFFNVPKNPLHGKYAIRVLDNGYKIELQNDSTFLVCSKHIIEMLKYIR